MDRNFERALSLVLRHEGGFVDHPSDPGGATNKGITIATMRRYVNRHATVDDLKRITGAQVAKVYRKHYWDKVKADDLPSGLDYAAFDFAVNSGPTRSAKFLQRVLGVKRDGVIGPVTLAAARSRDVTAAINQLCDDRMDFLQRLRIWPTFKNGWTRRVAEVRSVSLDMAKDAPPAPAKPAPSVPLPGKPERAPDPAPAPKAGIVAVIVALLIAAGAWLAGLPCDLFNIMCGG